MTAVAPSFTKRREPVRRAAPRARVLHIVLNLEAGGLERLVVELVNRSNPERFESHVLALQYAGRHAADLRDRDAMHVCPPQTRWSMAWPADLARAIASLAPDIVHTHSGVWYKASFAARIAGVRHTVHTDHGRLMPDPWTDRAIDRVAARRTNVVVAVSDPLARYMRAAVHVAQSRLRVIRNGVDVDAFDPMDQLDRGRLLRTMLGLADDAPVVGSIGRLDWIKGYDVMIEAFARLRANWTSGTPPVLVIAGDGPERLRLRGAVAALEPRVAADVHMLGWRTDVKALLASFDVFAMSSRSEGTSVSLLEAMSAGVCPVVTDVGGNADVLGDALAHRLVAPDDSAAFARALEDAFWSPAIRRRDALGARGRVEAAYSVDAMVQKYENLYAGLLEACAE